MNIKKSIYTLLIWLLLTPHVFAKERLIFAVDLVRHGDRTPINTLAKSPDKFRSNLGELTSLGKKQAANLGQKLRQYYVFHEHLLPEQYQKNTLCVQATDYHRTQQTAQFILKGLYPSSWQPSINNTSIHIKVVPEKDDHLLISKPTHHLFSLLSLYWIKHTIWHQKTKPLQTEMKHWREVTGEPLNTPENLISVADTLRVRKIHHIPMPKGMSLDEEKTIIRLGNWFFVTAFKQKDISYPMGHQFLLMINQQLKMAINHASSCHYILLTAHDSSIMSVMNTLGVPMEMTPPYVGRLNFSLFKNKNTYYLKVSFANQTIHLPGCDKEYCSLKQFSSIVNQ